MWKTNVELVIAYERALRYIRLLAYMLVVSFSAVANI